MFETQELRLLNLNYRYMNTEDLKEVDINNIVIIVGYTIELWKY